ncbi:hypothetical protein [Pseudomonas serboccidentalis]|uniref:hypothetical protein n=1 Tax=Pseudomonas serboccidentalis TaxID=2964670 RepID=UPI0039DF2FEA
MNFLDTRCQTGPFTDAEFGIRDDQEFPVAYVDAGNRATWVASVVNPLQRSVVFTAIDKCVIKDGEEKGRERCDCMLNTEDALYLVELKDRAGSGWQSQGIKQLESTIKFLIAAHGEPFLASYHPKIAYVCNKKSPFVKPEFNAKNLFSKYNFRLKIEAAIKVRRKADQ